MKDLKKILEKDLENLNFLVSTSLKSAKTSESIKRLRKDYVECFLGFSKDVQNHNEEKTCSGEYDFDSQIGIYFFNLAQIDFELKDYLESLKNVNLSLKINRENKDIYLLKGMIFQKMKIFDAAKKNYKRYIELGGDFDLDELEIIKKLDEIVKY